MDLAVEEINSSGGINGKIISIIYEDDQANPATAVSAAHKLIDLDKVSVIFRLLQHPLWQ